MRHVIEGHQWTEFCSAQLAAAVQLVREFYANYDPAVPNSIYIRNRSIPFTAEDINRIYNLPDVKDMFFDTVDDLDDVRLGEILRTLCVEGTTWTRASRGSMTFPHTSLKPGPLLWYHFLRFRLMPSTHDHVIHRERVVLLYCIVEGLIINVGSIIKQQIGVCASHNSGTLWFPCLISQLCRAYDVNIDESEPHQQPSAPITTAAISRILQEDAKPKIEARAMPGLAANAASAPTLSNSDIMASFNRLEQRISHMEVLQHEFMENMRDFWRYEQQRDLTLQKHFCANARRFHSFPAFPQHICEDLYGDYAPEEADFEEAAPDAPLRPSEVTPLASISTSLRQRDKGKAVVSENSSRRTTLRGIISGKRRG